MKKNSFPLVSLIITTRNEESVIEKLLKSIQTQTYSSIETILVDNHSTDCTCEIARTYVDKLIIQGPERSAQRNLGVRESNGDYVLILDADMELSPNVVKEAVSRIIKDPSIKAIIIPEQSFGQNFWARCKALERNCYTDNLTDVAGARFYNRQLFLESGGFDENMTGGEDWDLSQRIGKIAQIVFIQSLIYHNEGQINLLNQMRKKYYYALSLRGYIRKHPKQFWQQANILFRPAYFRHWRDLIKQPHLAVGMFFMRLCEGVAGAAGAFWGYYKGSPTKSG